MLNCSNSKSCVLIGYPSEQGGLILCARDRPLGLARKDQAFSVKMAENWPHFFRLYLFIELAL